MAEIKRIQLRGISCSPSDRMTEDGGVAESLNVQLDNTEIAPIEAPVIEEIMPNGTDDLYIHKTSQFAHYIGVVGTHIYYSSGNSQKMLTDLPSNAEIVDFASVGNALVMITTAGPYYFLWKEGKYEKLGSGVPTPDIDVITQFDPTELKDYEEIELGTGVALWKTPIVWDGVEHEYPQIPTFPTIQEWNKSEGTSPEMSYNMGETLRLFRDKIDLTNSEKFSNKYAYPVFVRYAIEMFDGQLMSCPPILCGVGINNSLNLKIEVNSKWIHGASFPNENANKFILQYRPYSIYVRLKNLKELQDYGELIKGVNFYMSPIVGNPGYAYNKTTMVDRKETLSENDSWGQIMTGSITANIRYDLSLKNLESKLVECSDKMRKVATINLQTLSDGTTIFSSLPFDETNLLLQESLTGEIMANNPVIPNGVFSYNNRLIFTQPSILNTYGMNILNATKASVGDEGRTYECTWVIKSASQGKVVVKKSFSTADKVYGFQTFPDRNCVEMWVKMSGKKEKTLFCDMKPHPTLNCAYGYILDGLVTTLYDSTQASYNSNDIPQGVAYVAKDNEIRVSEINNPFVFPPEGTFRFQSKVIGVATSGTPLSQGQFGQFPLLVFTEDGIWAMSVNELGEFVSIRPSSRIVCNNPKSITSTERGVLFSSEAGLMQFVNGEIINLSPNMMGGGRNQLSGAAKELVTNNTDKDLVPDYIGTDGDFRSFLRNCVITYDASGQRIILISKNQLTHQYVYSLKTATWHKTFNRRQRIKRVLNSYPECLCFGELLKEEYVDGDYNPIEYTDDCIFNMSTSAIEEQNVGPQQGVIITRPMDLGEPDVFKTITDIRVRGQYPKGAVKFILEGSNDGAYYHTLSTLRGRSWKLFRLTIIANLSRHDRISWVDVQYETKFTNKLR